MDATRRECKWKRRALLKQGTAGRLFIFSLRKNAAIDFTTANTSTQNFRVKGRLKQRSRQIHLSINNKGGGGYIFPQRTTHYCCMNKTHTFTYGRGNLNFNKGNGYCCIKKSTLLRAGERTSGTEATALLSNSQSATEMRFGDWGVKRALPCRPSNYPIVTGTWYWIYRYKLSNYRGGCYKWAPSGTFTFHTVSDVRVSGLLNVLWQPPDSVRLVRDRDDKNSGGTSGTRHDFSLHNPDYGTAPPAAENAAAAVTAATAYAYGGGLQAITVS